MTLLMRITDKIITYYQKYKIENLIEFVTTEDHYQISQINTIPMADMCELKNAQSVGVGITLLTFDLELPGFWSNWDY